MKSSSSRVTFSSLGYDETEGDERMRIGEGKEIVPIALVEAGERGQYEDRLLVADRVDGRSKIVHMIMYHRRWYPATAGRRDRLPERSRWRGKRVRGGIIELSSRG